jgi:hypothetical protein
VSRQASLAAAARHVAVFGLETTGRRASAAALARAIGEPIVMYAGRPAQGLVRVAHTPGAPHAGSVVLVRGATTLRTVLERLRAEHLEAVTVPALVYLDPPTRAQLRGSCGSGRQ